MPRRSLWRLAAAALAAASVLSGCGDGSGSTSPVATPSMHLPADLTVGDAGAVKLHTPVDFANSYWSVERADSRGAVIGRCLTATAPDDSPVGTNCYDQKTIAAGRAVQSAPIAGGGFETVGLTAQGVRAVAVLDRGEYRPAAIDGPAFLKLTGTPTMKLRFQRGARELSVDLSRGG